MHDEIDMTSLTLSVNALWEHQEKAVNLGDAAIAFINSLKLLPLCDHILQATDAGPRVACEQALFLGKKIASSPLDQRPVHRLVQGLVPSRH